MNKTFSILTLSTNIILAFSLSRIRMREWGKGLMGGFSVYFLLKEFLLLFQGKYQYKYSNAYEFKIF